MPLPDMCWLGTNNGPVMHQSERTYFQAFVLCCLLVAFVLVQPGIGAASSIIIVKDLQTETDPKVSSTAEPGVSEKSVGNESFLFEEPGRDVPAERPSVKDVDPEDCNVVTGQGEKPRIAIIIDDMGYHQRIGNGLLDLDMNLTYSFLPYGPFTRALEERAWQEGHDILVHMPMEARDPVWDPGPGTLYLADQPEIRARNAAENLASVPHAIGANNHMGSRFTEDSDAMRQFLILLKEKDLFFIDSSTSSQSIGMETARAMGIKTARRHVFLDNVQTQEDICGQLKLLIRKAVERGGAIGIGHPNEATLTALTRCRAMLLDQVQVVGIRELVQ